MNTPKDGGSAFPIAPSGTGDPRDGMTMGSDGMSLRDWFAGMVAAKVLSERVADNVDWPIQCQTTAGLSYDIADAMLRAREKLRQ